MVRYVWDGRVQRSATTRIWSCPPIRRCPHAHGRNRQMPSRPCTHAVSAGGAAVLPPRRRPARLLARDEAGLVACDMLTIVVLWRWLARHGATRVAGARVCVESAGGPRDRAQRAHRRARRALDRRLGLLAGAAATALAVDRVRPRRHDEASPDRARCRSSGGGCACGTRALAARRCSCSVPAVHVRPTLPFGAVHQRRRLHPVQRPAVQADRGAGTPHRPARPRCRWRRAWRSRPGVDGGCRYRRPQPGRGQWPRRWPAHR